ncbi:MAG: peptidase C15 [Leptolyngbya sp. SIO4C5]|nr:peptidase C15 [Leptolyngbya sp. SIO4C5]
MLGQPLPYQASQSLRQRLSPANLGHTPPNALPLLQQPNQTGLSPLPPPRLLLTAFRPWRTHQVSNSSDDLLLALHRQAWLPENTHVLRHLPVSFQLAHPAVIAKILWLQPHFVICCGMAENRSRLSLELQGIDNDQALQTPLPLSTLLQGTALTEISSDAGSYVCNHLYFQVLQFLRRNHMACQALFIHVPKLNQANLGLIMQDFNQILLQLSPPVHSSAIAPVVRLPLAS